VRDTVLCLCELGWLYARVAGYISAADSSGSTRGLVVQVRPIYTLTRPLSRPYLAPI